MRIQQESLKAFTKTQKREPVSLVETGGILFQESAEKLNCLFLFFLSLSAAVVFLAAMQIYW